jgi:hypothetical protein
MFLACRRRLGKGIVLLGFITSLGAAGCSSKGTISGKITYQGKPVTAGTVTFVPEKGGGAFTASIQEGEYKVEHVPPGPAKIAVSTPSSSSAKRYIEKMQPPPEMLKKGAPDRPAGEPVKPSAQPTVPIPPKFQNPETSGLTYTVKSGQQNFDIPIK